MTSAFIIKIVITAIFLIGIMGLTEKNVHLRVFAPIAIGLKFNPDSFNQYSSHQSSVNPARSTSVTFFAETIALSQLWLFRVTPIFGAIVGALIYKVAASEKD